MTTAGRDRTYRPRLITAPFFNTACWYQEPWCFWALTPPHCFQLFTNTHTHTHGQGQWSTGGQHSWTAVVQLCEWWRCWAAINVTCWRMMTEPTLECWTTLTPLCSSLFYSILFVWFHSFVLVFHWLRLCWFRTWGRSTPKNIQNILK